MSRFYSLIVPIVLLAGCSGGQDPTTVDAASEVNKPSVSEAVETKLALADKLDGAQDQTIGKCYACALGMNGKPDYVVEVEGYTAHLCSEHCREHFASHWQSVVAETDIPEPVSQ